MKISKINALSLISTCTLFIQGCGDKYERFTLDSAEVAESGTFITVDTGNLSDFKFIPNQVTDVQLDIVGLGSVLGAKSDISGAKVSAQVYYDPSKSRAELRTVSLIDMDSNTFPLKAFAVDSEGKTGVFVECEECATYEINTKSEILEFISIEAFPIQGFTALKKVSS
jgi:hypothetical protein